MARLEADRPDARQAIAGFALDWHDLRARLERHHQAEDDDLWPILQPHLTAADERHEVDRMIQEHQNLATLIAEVDRALTSKSEVAASIGALGEAMRDHLAHEERSVLPLLERHLSRAEWRGFLFTERRRTPLRERSDFLGWVLDDANPADTAAVLSELPPPARVVYRHIIGPRYSAKHRNRHATGTRT